MKIISDSTQDFFKESANAENPSFWNAIHGWFYARYPYLYIGVGVGEHWLAKALTPFIKAFSSLRKIIRSDKQQVDDPSRIRFEDTYHGKVVPLAAAKQLVTVKEDIHLENLESVIPYRIAKDIILQEPTHIAALDCPCRVNRENPCLPLDVCLIIGEPFVNFIQEHHPTRSRVITQTEALSILEAEDRRGHVHHAFFKEAMLGRFYAICNCCSCCCGAMQAQRNGTPMLASSGYLAVIDEALCLACGTCVDYCQFNALSLDAGINSVDPQLCMGCGICVSKCPQDAISLRLEPSRGIPLELDQLLSAAVGSIR